MQAISRAMRGLRWRRLGWRDFLFLLGSACFLQIGDERHPQEEALPALLDELSWARRTATTCRYGISEDAVAALASFMSG